MTTGNMDSKTGPTITLQFDPRTLSRIRSAVFARGLSGNATGILDAFILKLVEKVEAGETSWDVQQKRAAD